MSKGARTEMVLEEMVDLLKPNPPQENDYPKEGYRILLGFSQIYDPEYVVSGATNDGIPILTVTFKKMKTTIEAITEKETLTELSDTLHLPTSMEAFMQSMKSNGTTFMNCTFNFK